MASEDRRSVGAVVMVLLVAAILSALVLILMSRAGSDEPRRNGRTARDAAGVVVGVPELDPSVT